jgi:1-acyl-sn-glycerol-3-phosphate acyltransferase
MKLPRIDLGDAAVSALRLYGRVTYPVMRTVAEPALRQMFQLHPEGLEHVPKHGAAILAPNHLSFVDPFCVALGVPRRITFIGKAEYTDSWITRWFMELGGVIPVRREDSEKAATSLELGAEVLKNGDLLGIFPEGTRSPDGRLYKGKTGAARMALDADCPVIPVGLIGTEKVLPKDAKVPKRTKVHVRFGRPMHISQEAREDPHVLRTFTDDLMHAIADLTGQTYRHRYSYNKRLAAVEAPVPLTFRLGE